MKENPTEIDMMRKAVEEAELRLRATGRGSHIDSGAPIDTLCTSCGYHQALNKLRAAEKQLARRAW
jgi:hypothetical protein